MPRLPTPDPQTGEINTDDYARLTFDLWEGLNGKMQFYVKRWRRTLDFLRDMHWNTLKEFDQSVLPSWRRFPLQNYTLAYYNDFLTDYLKSEVRFSAVPTSPDPHDIDSAELSEQLMKYLWDRLGFDQKRIDLGAWVMACGTGAIRIFWDTDTGQQVPLAIKDEEGNLIPVNPDTLEPDPSMEEPVLVDKGEIGVEVISPQFVRWAINPAHGVMVGLLLSFEEVVAFWGEDVAERLSYSDSHEGISASLNRIEQPGITPSVDQRTLVIEHYLPQSAQHPKGLWWTSAQQGKMMIHPPWPLPAGRIPIVSFRWIPMPGEKHIGLSPLYGITFSNKIYEEVTARILEWYGKAKPKRLLKAGGGITVGDFTDEPFQEVMVNAGGEPENLDTDDAPSGLFQIQQMALNDMLFTSGRPFEEGDSLPEGISQGIRTPAELKSSKSIATALMCSKVSWKETGETLMHYVGNFYNEERVVAVQGPDRGFMWRTFAGEDLMRDGALASTIHVDDIPLYPQNRQNLRDTVIALLQTEAGSILFAGPDGQLDMDRIKGALLATGLDVSMDVIDPDVLEARNEQVEFQNLDPQQPLEIEPQSWQNHAVHHAEHVKIPKSLRFRAWSEEARKAFLEHIAATEEILNEAAEAEAEAMVDQERKLRQVREQEELRADVMREWAKSLIELVAETTGIEIQDIMGLLERPEDKGGKDGGKTT